MAKARYSYQKDWNAIYSTTKAKPWIGHGVPPYLMRVFENEEFFKLHQEDQLLDIGCGDGAFCNYIAEKRYSHIKGIDTSDVIIEQCQRNNRHKNNVTFERKDIITDSFASDVQYDIIVCWLVLHHILPEDLTRFATNISSLCKSGGDIYISVLLPDNAGYSDRESLFSDAHRVQFYPSDEIINLFSASFQTVSLEGNGCEESPFQYYILKCTSKLSEKDNDIIRLLNSFDADCKNDIVSLPETEFIKRFTNLFRHISRILYNIIRIGGEDVVIFKIDIKTNFSIYSASKVYNEQLYCKTGRSEGNPVNSRAYDLFLLYNDYIKTDKSGKDFFTLHRHFQEEPDLKYVLFDRDNLCAPIRFPSMKSQIGDPDYLSFLSSFFAPINGLNEEDGFVPFVKKNQERISDGFIARSFSCFNLGIAGFESWGTMMIESTQEKDVVKSHFFDKNDNETATLQKIKNIFFILKKIAYDYYENLITNAIKTQAVKAAIAQVMARNMSHNFGSHVLSKLMNNNVCEKIVANCDNSNISNYFRMFPDDIDNTPQLAHFNSYLKSRMDYLSEVTFGVSDMVTTRMMFGNVMRELDCQQLLLNHIPGIDSFNYKFEIKYNGKELSCDTDIAAAFPNDVLGCQAFYNIIENIIRNTAKHHSWVSGADIVTFTIRIKESDSGVDCLYCVEIDDGLKKEDIDSLVISLNGKFKESVLDRNNNLRNHSLGLLEMKASAAFLRQIDLVDAVSEYFNGIKIIEAFNAEGALGYRFYLQKPKEFIFIGDDWSLDEDKTKDEEIKQKLARNAGIEFMGCNEFKSSMESGKAFAHQFLIYDSTLAAEILSKTDYMTLLPLRQILVDDKDMMAVTDMLKRDVNKAIESLKEFSWGKIVKASRTQDVVAFFNHGNGGLKAFYGQYTESGKCIENILSNTQGKYPRFSTFSSCKSKDGKPWTAYLDNIPEQIRKEICEAYESKVIIIDERVQRFAEDGFEGAIPCWALFRSTKVSIPRCHVTDSNGQNVAPKIMGVDPVSKEVKFVDMPAAQAEMEVIPLGTKDLADYRDKLEGYIKKRIRNSCLIIHYGILERLYGRNRDDIKKMLENWAACARRVIVTSGRGAHSLDLPDTVCFASLSSVLYACTENRNKFIINNLINQARRKRK